MRSGPNGLANTERYPEPGKRRCTRCSRVKPFAEFVASKTAPGGAGSQCKECKKAAVLATRRAQDGLITPEKIALFWARVKKGVPGPLPTPCWIWQGAPRNHEGYGQFHFAGRNHAPHTIVLMLLEGFEGSREVFVDHLCRVRMCCNPAHLRLVTPRQNSLENNSSPFARNANLTHCPKCGSELAGDNVRWKPCRGPMGTPMATRICLVCWREKHPTTSYRPNSREDAMAVARTKYGGNHA